jgi:peptide/nickel transport system substrate-binding protein
MVNRKDEREMGEFERGAYEYARQWATSLNRRDLLKAFGTAGVAGAALLASPERLLAAPAGKPNRQFSRSQDAITLKIARGQLSDTLDPHKSTLLVAHEVMWQIYDSLIYLDASGQVLPGAATEWTFSEDNLSITFTLREINFHDGTPLTAQVVKDTVTRMLDPATASPNVGMLGPLESVDAIDDRTVAYNFTAPFVPIFVGLGFSYCAPISTAAVAQFGDEFGRHPVGTGPYKFVDWTADDTIILEKNAEHDWSTPYYAVQQPPQIDHVEFVVIPDDATRLAAVTSGEVDIVAGTDAVPIDKINSLKEESGIVVTTAPVTGVYYMNLNHKMAPFDNLKVRQAINYAIDRQSIVDLVLDGNGKPATSLLASAFAAADQKIEPSLASRAWSPPNSVEM